MSDTPTSPCSTCPAPSPATASTPGSPPTTAPSTASSAPSRPATASSTSPTATWCGSRPRPADLAALPDHPAPPRPGARGADRGADPEPAGPRRARVSARRRRGLHGAHRARPRWALVEFLLPDAVHDAGRGHRRHRGARGRLAPRGRPGSPTTLRVRSPRPAGAYAEAAGPACGFWAFEALRIARGEPRLGLDTDHRTIPNEAGWIGPAVHLDKGCYRGQETVARVHTLGRPPRRLTLLHLDGSENLLPAVGTELGWGRKSSASSAPRPGTTSSARSRWRWSSATCPWRASSTPTGCLRRRRLWSIPRSDCTFRPNCGEAAG